MYAQATPKQLALVEKLAVEVYGADNAPEFVNAAAECGTFENRIETSRFIDTLIEKAREARKANPAARPVIEMPEPGYYAVETGGRLGFYAVREGKGKWAGRRFLNRYRSDYLDRMAFADQRAVVEAIKIDPHEARMTFARETVRCFTCGRRLTDAVSRARGQGSDCYGRGRGI